MVRDDPGQMPIVGGDDDDDGMSSLKLLNNSYSLDERIELLMKTFTQELYKKLSMAIFEEDKKLVTCILVMRVMEAENFIDKKLNEFLLSGPKSLQPTVVPQEINNAPWLTNMVWADLKYLSTIKPFNS